MGLGESKTLKQQIRENERKINKIVEVLEEEIKNFETEEAKMVAKYKETTANQKDNDVIRKTMALNVHRIRNARSKLMNVIIQMTVYKTANLSAASLQHVAVTMKTIGSTLGTVNRQLSPEAMSRLTMNFERQVDMLNNNTQLVHEAIDGAAGDEAEDDEASDQIMARLDEEMGMVTMQQLQGLPVRSPMDEKQATPSSRHMHSSNNATGQPRGPSDQGGGVAWIPKRMDTPPVVSRVETKRITSVGSNNPKLNQEHKAETTETTEAETTRLMNQLVGTRSNAPQSR